jgi:GxxExxY protein
MKFKGVSKKLINDIPYSVIGAAIEVHKEMGPGLLESIYEECLCEELQNRSIKFKRQAKLPLLYKEKVINKSFYIDILVEDLVVVELKAVDVLLPIHEAQLLTYLKLAKKPKGLLINFNVDNISKTLVPMVSKYFEELE